MLKKEPGNGELAMVFIHVCSVSLLRRGVVELPLHSHGMQQVLAPAPGRTPEKTAERWGRSMTALIMQWKQHY